MKSPATGFNLRVIALLAAGLFAWMQPVRGEGERAEEPGYTYSDEWAIVSAPPPPGPYQAVNLDPRVPGQESNIQPPPPASAPDTYGPAGRPVEEVLGAAPPAAGHDAVSRQPAPSATGQRTSRWPTRAPVESATSWPSRGLPAERSTPWESRAASRPPAWPQAPQEYGYGTGRSATAPAPRGYYPSDPYRGRGIPPAYSGGQAGEEQVPPPSFHGRGMPPPADTRGYRSSGY